jgi:hypothetical protein
MATGSEHRVRWIYTDNNAYTWALSADAYITAQGTPPKVGGAVDTARTHPTPYCQFRKRRVVCHDPTSGKSRVVTLFDPAPPLATVGTTILLNTIQSDGTEAENTYYSGGTVLPEGSRRKSTYNIL